MTNPPARSTPQSGRAPRLIAVGYVVIVLALTLLPIFGLHTDDPVAVQTTPFTSIRAGLAGGIRSEGFAFVVGNVLMFVPLGVLIPVVLQRRSVLLVFLAALALSAGVELGQLAISLLVGFNYRNASVDDVILNVSGAVLGYLGFVAVTYARRTRHDDAHEPPR